MGLILAHPDRPTRHLPAYYHPSVDVVQRDRISLAVDPRVVPERPQVPVRQFTLRPDGLAPLDALIAKYWTAE